jgi:hypothetical protein
MTTSMQKVAMPYWPPTIRRCFDSDGMLYFGHARREMQEKGIFSINWGRVDVGGLSRARNGHPVRYLEPEIGVWRRLLPGVPPNIEKTQKKYHVNRTIRHLEEDRIEAKIRRPISKKLERFWCLADRDATGHGRIYSVTPKCWFPKMNPRT